MRLYHGTNFDNALDILGSGRNGVFNAGTWFGKHLETALAFGGPWVFCLFLDPCPDWARMDGDGWQCRNPDPLPSYGTILWLREFKESLLVFGDLANEAAMREFHAGVNPGKKVCDICRGHGEVGYDATAFIKGQVPRPATKPCPVCKGVGAIN